MLGLWSVLSHEEPIRVALNRVRRCPAAMGDDVFWPRRGKKRNKIRQEDFSKMRTPENSQPSGEESQDERVPDTPANKTGPISSRLRLSRRKVVRDDPPKSGDV